MQENQESIIRLGTLGCKTPTPPLSQDTHSPELSSLLWLPLLLLLLSLQHLPSLLHHLTFTLRPRSSPAPESAPYSNPLNLRLNSSTATATMR